MLPSANGSPTLAPLEDDSGDVDLDIDYMSIEQLRKRMRSTQAEKAALKRKIKQDVSPPPKLDICDSEEVEFLSMRSVNAPQLL